MEGDKDSIDPPRNGIIGHIDLYPRESAVDLTGQIHQLPCCIKHDGPCDVSHYFKPKKTDVVNEGLIVEEASFRGRRLQGATVPLPEGYCGFVLGKRNPGKAIEIPEGNFNRWEMCAKFQNITYWNHDNLPSHNDAFLRSFHWFSVVNALHKPATADDLASTSI